MSEDQILSALKTKPRYILSSENKIRKVMGFFVHELKISPLVISETPGLVLFSLEKSIVPKESAVSASKKLEIGTQDELDSVLNLLKSIGLSQSHIKNLVEKRPVILVADARKTLKPNVEVFGSLGFFGTNLVKLLIKEPRILETDAHATVEFFRAYGFTIEQIFVLTMKLPVLYLFKAPQVFKPKLEYFKSLGFSDAEISQILASEPYILARSLENWIIPSVQVIRRVVGTNENVLKLLKACYRILDYDLQEIIEPNIAVLINHGVKTEDFLYKSNKKILKYGTVEEHLLLIDVSKEAGVVLANEYGRGDYEIALLYAYN
ncbi:hypothetical protein Vadar_024159 [Vaccinium darrowii]|uniref:Uncharacterized protein n=1 Tax=Vaccinium darrowii TaxID=229202 RepID=A0ACB7Z022_9ERIC|nr:hypothetical protein Vadar_024159 [Vaccinium darrowii]